MQPAIHIQINLTQVRKNIEQIRARCGVPVVAVIKADAYGLGISEIVRAIDDLVDSYYVFEPREILNTSAHQLTARSFIATVCGDLDAAALAAHRVRPVVWTVEQALRWRECDPVLAVDTGQQRFACTLERIDEVIAAGGCREAFTHASAPGQAEMFRRVTAGKGLRLHAAGTSLLDCPAAYFDAVRPGLALYRGAVRVSTRLLDARESRGPAGYTGFQVPQHGVIFGGYSDGLSAGVCIVNGVRRRLLEIGMQTAFVELGSNDRPGDEVVLLGDGLTEQDAGNAWRCGPQEALWRLARSGARNYVRP